MACHLTSSLLQPKYLEYADGGVGEGDRPSGLLRDRLSDSVKGQGGKPVPQQGTREESPNWVGRGGW